MDTVPYNKFIGLIATSFVLASTQPCLAQPTNRSQQLIPRITMDNVPLSDAVKNLARQADINYILDPHIPSDSIATPVTFTLENVDVKDALYKILRLRDLAIIENPATSVMRIAPAKLGVKPVSAELLKSDTNTVIPVIMFEEVPFQDAVKSLAQQLQLKITFDDKFTTSPSGQTILSKQVSARWKNLTAKQALVALLDNYDLTLLEEPSGESAKITEKKTPAKSP
jgi:hypothetical protein